MQAITESILYLLAFILAKRSINFKIIAKYGRWQEPQLVFCYT
jgi:hypothetical protein